MSLEWLTPVLLPKQANWLAHEVWFFGARSLLGEFPYLVQKLNLLDQLMEKGERELILQIVTAAFNLLEADPENLIQKIQNVNNKNRLIYPVLSSIYIDVNESEIKIKEENIRNYFKIVLQLFEKQRPDKK